MSKKLAVIDLGTNTFQMIVATQERTGFTILFQKSTPSKIGKDGINRKVITDDAIHRAVSILADFEKELQRFGIFPKDVFVFGTSAVRNAANQDEFIDRVRDQMGFSIRVIDGSTEAQLIYLGVREAVHLGANPNLIMDIGGGSVEFIIADQQDVFWKKSFEIGGQRLIERFVKSDPLSAASRKHIFNFLDEQLIPLSNAIHQYAPQVLVGSSGTFETLAEMDHWSRLNDWPPAHQTGFDIPLEVFEKSRNLILSSDRAARLGIPGMKELRVDLISVAVCLIEYIVNAYPINRIKASRYSLKEGALSMFCNDNLNGT